MPAGAREWTILHGARKPDEAARRATFPGETTHLADDVRVRAELTTRRWALFACHAEGDLADSARNHLLLTDPTDRPLTLVDLLRLHLDAGELAFLFACATACTGSRIADEAVQLAAAVQLASYRHVTATLWPVGDQPPSESLGRLRCFASP